MRWKSLGGRGPWHARGRALPLSAVSLLAAGALGLAACTGVTVTKGDATASPSAVGAGTTLLPSPSPPTYNASNAPIVQVVKRVAPAVVNVTSNVASAGIGGLQEGQDVGTGFIVASSGIIVTNYHVVEGALNIKVTLNCCGNASYSAHVIGGDSAHDLAVLKIDAGRSLPTVPLGNSAKVLLGEQVVAIGYPLALPGGPTVTAGIISSTARTVTVTDPNGPNGQPIKRTYEDALQTDAAINPGNSGGPLVDLNGNVIGINTAGVPSSTANTIGFAIAINAAKPIVEQAIAHPRAAVAYLGVDTQQVTAGLAAQFGLPVSRGALVLALAPGGPAQKAGIKVNDIIVSFNGTGVTSPDQLGQLIQAQRPGAKAQVGVVAPGGSRRTVTVTLGIRPLP